MSENSDASPWKDPAIWGRVVFVVLFLLLFALIVGPLAIVLGAVQVVFTIFTGEENRNLRVLAAVLAEYVREILLFASWNRERRPFPFSEFPRVEGQEDAADFGEGELAAEPKPAAEAESESQATGAGNAGHKVCPECGHEFKGSGWEGMDAHWRGNHEHIMPYAEAWPLVETGNYRSSVGGEPE